VPEERIQRPKLVNSMTTRIKTGCGDLYVTIGYKGHQPMEILTKADKAGSCTVCQLEALTRSITLGLKFGIPLENYMEELRGLQCPNPNMFPKVERALSCPDGISKVMGEYLDGHKKDS
jgi:ribonucleoside-diphosphate reductase alpha chain